jgi:hypothetical protein
MPTPQEEIDSLVAAERSGIFADADAPRILEWLGLTAADLAGVAKGEMKLGRAIQISYSDAGGNPENLKRIIELFVVARIQKRVADAPFFVRPALPFIEKVAGDVVRELIGEFFSGVQMRP